jgi:hypothetical protein
MHAPLGKAKFYSPFLKQIKTAHDETDYVTLFITAIEDRVISFLL